MYDPLVERDYAGKWHDKMLVEDEMYALPVGSVVMQDRGFQGLGVPGLVMWQLTKSPVVAH